MDSGSFRYAQKLNTEESDIQTAGEGRCNCQESDCHLRGTLLELAFGRRPADLIQLDVATPTQLTIDRNEEELTAIQIKQLSKQAFQEARQSEDIRRDLAQNLRMSSKPLQVKDKVFYWQEDKPKIRSDGSKGGIWLKGKVISIEGAMVGLDLGTRLIKVNMTKVRKDETIPPGKPGIDLLLPEERESLQKEQPGSSADTKKKESSAPAPKPRSSVPLRIAGKQLPNLQHSSGREHVRRGPHIRS